jgi:hypothetical protein
MREDEEMRRTGIIQSERQVFELAREHFGPGRVSEPKCREGSMSETYERLRDSGTAQDGFAYEPPVPVEGRGVHS